MNGWAPRMRRCMRRTHFGDGEVAILYADNPLIRPDTLRRLLQRREAGDAGWYCLPSVQPTLARYGRVIARDGFVERIVEWVDASERYARSICATPAYLRAGRRHAALAARGTRRQCQGRILSHRCRRAGGRTAARCRGGSAGRRTRRHQFARRAGSGGSGDAGLAAHSGDGSRSDDDRSRPRCSCPPIRNSRPT